MKTEISKIFENKNIAKDVYRIVLNTSIAKDVQCGQFVQVEVPNYFLRRPISVSEVIDEHTLVIIYKVVGDGTKVLSQLKENEEVSLFGPCGTGFPIKDTSVTLIGGGVGVPPLLETAKHYISNKQHVSVVLGFNSKDDMILVEAFEKLGCEVYIATMDGSFGTKGTVIDAINENQLDVDYVLACGPLPMLKAIQNTYSNGYISLESRMACGMGACMGCVVKDNEGNSLRVCKDGPVFEIGKVVL